ncbi:glycosyltransferase family 2 protein [Pontivivens insulae]|uniref:N-acetylglucosaminyl-diphospho-decaprenol L-rhamnosyltransferase n=1 Tax=Pontivivens insulae TaxID=1639689 RepID=A0A2R8A827_9RHOB|nr:glycosyltransferase [Pontivivens insulae]RED18496.1 glycosyl transferase family 2 [Pontivivens insulae]SPF28394.1 N-acetylglucosaminyl-diphospho-decaprenol L-rhamnosyltransferase [Pontivivens insulae]
MTSCVSVIILHTGQRDHHLARALTAIFAQRRPADEVIVVSDKAIPLDLRVTWAHIKGNNVASARNVGLSIATGDLIAFCDDDAAPEPGWLGHLLPAFDTPRVGAAGGPVRGSDGIQIQWGETRFDADGADRLDGAHVKLNGTNMMLRRAAVKELGGFDPEFRYYLDETDLLLRMEAAGWKSAWVDAAEVHHSAAPNAIRGATANASGFKHMGQSLARFCDKHLPAPLHETAKAQFLAEQRRRLLRRFQIGRLDATQLSERLDALRLGLNGALSATEACRLKFMNEPSRSDLPKSARARVVIASRLRTRHQAHELARRLVGSECEVTLLAWRYLNSRRQVRLTHEGYWLHSGGLYARRTRDRRWSGAVRRELARIKQQRAPNVTLHANRDRSWLLCVDGNRKHIPATDDLETLQETVLGAL